MISQSKSHDELAWWVALQCAEKVGAATFHRLVNRFGSPHDALTQASADALQGMAGADSSLLDSIVFAAIRIDYTRKLLERLDERGVTIITFDDPDFPAALKRLKWVPPVLYVRGSYDEERDSRAIGIVGATHPAARAFRMAYQSAGALVDQGYTIVSGGAHGIDTAAHLGALDAGGRTVVVPPMGILSFRPSAELSQAAFERQAVVLSECPPEAPWETHAAIARNRITAALSLRLFVVEALPGGGTMNTFHCAKKIGMPTMAAVYGPDTPEGNLIAVREGAAEVKSVAELLEAVNSDENIPPGAQQSFDWN